MKISPIIAGVAGEYFVAAELSRRGYIASISLRNTRGIDILATNAKASRSVTIQCKTTRLKNKVWMLNKKCEHFVSDNHFYVLVSLRGISDLPNFHIVPSKQVAKVTKRSHRKWLVKLRRDGGERKNNSLRLFPDRDDKYLGKWNLLGL